MAICLDVFLSIEEIPNSASFNLKMRVHGYGDKTKKVPFKPDADPYTVSGVIKHSLSGMCFPERVREVFFHNSLNNSETPLESKMYKQVLRYLKDAQTDSFDQYKIVIQGCFPEVRGI